MSVLMTMRLKADGGRLEEYAAANGDRLRAVSARGKEHGVIYHRFYATDDEIVAVDVWPDEASFQRFFEASPEIGQIMQEVGVSSEPVITFWRPLTTGDEVG